MEKELNKKIDVNYFETTEVYTVKLSLFAVIVIELGLECLETGLGLDFESEQMELGTISGDNTDFWYDFIYKLYWWKQQT